jgi:predicted DsbA family dithiol-disulfide isomerase
MSRLGFDPAQIESRMADPEDPALVRVRGDMALAARLGIRTTPSFIVMVEGAPPVSADQRTLPAILNSEPVLRHLVIASAARPRP